MLPNPDVEALEKALAVCEVAQNELKIENCRLHLRLRQAMERNNQLERKNRGTCTSSKDRRCNIRIESQS